MAQQTSQMRAGPSVTSKNLNAHHDKPEEHVDTNPSDQQPPGVDDDDMITIFGRSSSRE